MQDGRGREERECQRGHACEHAHMHACPAGTEYAQEYSFSNTRTHLLIFKHALTLSQGSKQPSAFQKQILAEKEKEKKKASIRSTIKTFNSIHLVTNKKKCLY
jgi:hypothetical protein